MATKTISITEEAYRKLARLKRENESFSIVIERITGKAKLSELYGILSKHAGDKLEKSILEGRKIHGKTREKRHKELIWGIGE